MIYCRFEDRHTHQALEFTDCVGRVSALSEHELDQVFGAIRHAQQQGWWTALILNYELGDALQGVSGNDPSPLITALFFDQRHDTTPWDDPAYAHPELHCAIALPKHRYLQHIQEIKTDIRNGEYYQINYSLPISVQSQATPESIYRSLAANNPIRHGAYIVDGNRVIASFSPELFIEKRGDVITARPMKGTRPRFDDPQADAASATALRSSPKDCAENIMIVDLLRNDLGRIAQPGTVSVDQLLEVEQYPSVWTMTSTIRAKTAVHDLREILLALFPCGSITGAPKLAAMRKIHELESRKRGAYCGSLGWLSPTGDFSLNVAIRTLEFTQPGQAIFSVGGGIVADSDPEQEWEECLWKARVLGTTITVHNDDA